MRFLGFLMAVVAAMALWNVLSPRSVWASLSAWRYRDPEANEPSDAAFTVSRIASLVGLVACVVVAVIAFQAASENDGTRQQREYQECLDSHQDDTGLLQPEDWCAELSPTPRTP